MARPSKDRTITKRYRINETEQQRLARDAAEAKLDESSYTRFRLFTDKPLTTGKGMPRHELLAVLADITEIIRLTPHHPKISQLSQRIAQRTLNALQDDNPEP